MLTPEKVIFSTTNAKIDGQVRWLARIEFEKPIEFGEWEDITKFLNAVFSVCVNRGLTFIGSFDGGDKFYMNFLVKEPINAVRLKFHVYNKLMWR